MRLDIRIPTGLLFLLLGLVLLGTGWGLGLGASGREVDLVWGGVLFLFGAGMLALARRGRGGRPDV